MKILWKILLSLLLAASILWLMELVFKFGLRYNRNYKISYIQKNHLNADLLIHGPCQGEWTVDPILLEKYIGFRGYNLSLSHANFADNYLYLTIYLKTQKKPKVVLLYVTPDSFAENGTNTFISYQYASLINNGLIKDVVKDFDYSYVNASNIPFIKYSYYSNFTFFKSINGWKDYLLGYKVPLWPSGYVAPLQDYNRTVYFKEQSPKTGIFVWSPRMEKYFIKIIELLRRENIALILFESPIYHQSLKKQKNRDEIIKKIKLLCNDNRLPFFMFDTLPMNFNKQYFFATYNTTIEGNDIFNPLLGQVLKDTLPSILMNYLNKPGIN